MRKAWKVLTVALVLSCIASTGCGKDEKTGGGGETASDKKMAYETVGNESEDALQMLMTNQTGLEIVGISVKSSNQSEYPANMLRSKQSIAPDEKVIFYFTPESVAQTKEPFSSRNEEKNGAEDGAAVAEAVINLTYRLQITCTDGTIMEATLFPAEDIEDVALCMEDDIFYLTYKSKTDGTEVSTKEAEAAAAYNRAVAANVMEQIEQLGEVTLESETALTAVRAAYDALTEEQKQQVGNVQVLTDKEIQLENLKQQAAAQREAEQQAAWESSQQTGNQNSDSQNYDDGGVDQETDNCLGGVAFN